MFLTRYYVVIRLLTHACIPRENASGAEQIEYDQYWEGVGGGSVVLYMLKFDPWRGGDEKSTRT